MEETRNENGQENSNEKVHERKQGIVVEHVYKSFGKEHVLVDVNLEIPPGKIYGVVGNNGSGKTVLMKCICGFMHPDKGQIYVGGSRVGKECDFPDKLGVIIETPGFLPALSGYKNLKILADLKGRIGKNEISLKESGKAIMLASHNAQDIEMLCDYVHEMEDWK